MNKKAEDFKKYLETKAITCFTVEEIDDDQLNTVVFRSTIEVEGVQLPTIIILDSSIYGMVRVLIAPSALKESNELDLLRQIFEIENIVVGSGVVAGDDNAFGDVWGTSAVLAYVSPGADVNANIEEPSYGYGYRIEGMPLVEQPYWDNSAKSWIYGVSNDATPVLSGMAAGFLIQGAGN